MAFVALDGQNGELAGIGRLSCEPDHGNAEFALLVRTDLQGRGIGRMLLRCLIDCAAAEGIGRIEGYVLRENVKMLEMCEQFGFTLESHPEETGVVVAAYRLREAA